MGVPTQVNGNPSDRKTNPDDAIVKLDPATPGAPEGSLSYQIQEIRYRHCTLDTLRNPSAHSNSFSQIGRVVSAAFKIELVYSIDPIQSTFKCRFRVYLEWLEPAAVGAEEGRASEDLTKLIEIPDLSVTNAISLSVEDKSLRPWVVKPETGHVAVSMLYSATVQVKYNMSLFPFDSQWLFVSLDMSRKKDADRTFCFQFCDISDLRGLDEWQAHSSFGERDLLNGHARVTFGVLIQRLSRYYVLNLILMLFLCASLCFTLYAIEPQRYAERAKIFMVLSLTLVDRKSVV